MKGPLNITDMICWYSGGGHTYQAHERAQRYRKRHPSDAYRNPNMVCRVIDWVVQAYGGGTNNDVGIASAYATARMLRLADGPDEVHRNQIAKLELGKYVRTRD